MNKVTIIDWYGGDKAIARAAWTSTQADVELKTEEEIDTLLVKKLWNNDTGKPHKTPFERGIVEWVITCEQASHIHLLKHRLANINGESARYREIKHDSFYVPQDWIEGTKSSAENGVLEYWADKLTQYSQDTNVLYHQCLNDLAPILGRKRAKESARYFKMMNSQISLSVMMNMSCFYNFYNLRSADDAQKEIQWIAEAMLQAIKDIPGSPFKSTIKAFGI